MSDDFPVKAEDTAIIAMLSPCVGGLVRTWTDAGPSRLWSVPDAEYLRSIQGTGTIARTPREERRYREVAFLTEDAGTLMIQSRFPKQTEDGSLQFDGSVIRLQPAAEPTGSTFDDMRSLLEQAINSTLNNQEFLLVEMGGWDAPAEPFCLFIVFPDGDGLVSVIETAPNPSRSEIWAPHIVPGRDSTTLSAPSTAETIEVAPLIMLDAIATWGVQPWDLALTFGTRTAG